jgi:hypothetical protein
MPMTIGKHANWVSSNAFDVIGVTYEFNSPIFYYKYFMSEAMYGSVSGPMMEAFNLIFELTAAPAVPSPNGLSAVEGNIYRLKPAMAPIAGRTERKGDNLYGHDYTFSGGAASANAWRDALKKLLIRGFYCVKANSLDKPSRSLQTAMLEAKYVEYISADATGGQANPGVRVFWRCDSRPKERFIDINAAVARVDTQDAAADCNVSESWHPFSEGEIKSMLWLRRQNRDNDYYTIVSVGLDFRTCTAFPTLDENKAYSFPAGADGYSIKPLSQWTLSQLQAQKNYLVTASVNTGYGTYNRVRVATKIYGYMAAFNSGVVINTQDWGGEGGVRFPERAVRGFPSDAVVAYLPMLRVHHGPSRRHGFTIFPARGDDPRLLITEAELKHRFGAAAAAQVLQEYENAVQAVRGKMRSAWSGGGFAEPEDSAVSINSIVDGPPVQCEKAGAERLT